MNVNIFAIDLPTKPLVSAMNTTNVNDLVGAMFPGHHQPPKVWILCLYFMGLNLSNNQITQELDRVALDLSRTDVQEMTEQLSEGIVKKSQK